MADRGKKDQALQQLQDELDLPTLPRRIECYDISNIQGTSAVGSMVVFEDGNPKRSEYRRFRIKGVGGQNDFAMMHEVLKRRFWRARRQTEQDGANENQPLELGVGHETDREAVEEELAEPNAGATMDAPDVEVSETRMDGEPRANDPGPVDRSTPAGGPG